MFRMRFARLAVAAAGLALIGGSVALSGQAPAGAEGTGPSVLGSGSFSPIIASLQKTMQFYSLLGIEVPEGSTTCSAAVLERTRACTRCSGPTAPASAT